MGIEEFDIEIPDEDLKKLTQLAGNELRKEPNWEWKA